MNFNNIDVNDILRPCTFPTLDDVQILNAPSTNNDKIEQVRTDVIQLDSNVNRLKFKQKK